MRPDKLVGMFSCGDIVTIGVEPNSNREHYVFYSEEDYQCFVAIVDNVNYQCVTILPIDYHNLIAWQVSNESMNKAKEMILGVSVMPRDETLSDVSVKIVNNWGEYIRAKTIGRFFVRSVDDIRGNEEIMRGISDAGIMVGKDGLYLDTVAVRNKKSGSLFQFNIKDL